MSNLKIRLATSTALVTAMVGYFNLPAKANPDFVEGQNPVRISTVPIADHDQSAIMYDDLKAEQNKLNNAFGKNSKNNQTENEPIAKKPLLTKDDKNRALKEVGAGHLRPEDIQAQRDRAMNLQITPLIDTENGIVSDRLIQNSKISFLTEDYAYCVTKGNVQLADQALQKLEAMGCKLLGSYSALEGKHMNFNTIAGSVFYNSEKNEYFIVWHGTASNEEGWQTNLDFQLVGASEIKDQILQVIRDEVITTLRDEKSPWLLGLFDGAEDPQLSKIMTFVKSNLTADLSIEELRKFRDKLKGLISSLAPKTANKQPTDKERALLEKIDSIFAVKMEMLGKQDYVVHGLKAASVTALKGVIEEIDEGLGLTPRDAKNSTNSPLAQKIKGIDNLKTKQQLHQAMNDLKQLAKDVQMKLPNCSTEQEVLAYMDELKTNVNEIMGQNGNFFKKMLKSRNSVLKDISTRLISSLESAVTERQKELSRLGKFHEIEFKGKIHRGYGLKIASAGPQIEDIIRHHAESLDKDLRQKAAVTVIGHSMAGSLAKLYAAIFMQHYSEIFGNLPTATNGRLSVHAISAAACTGDNTFRKSLEHGIGLGNIADQMVAEDFVPNSDPLSYVPDRFKYLIAKMPWAGKQLASMLESEYAPRIGTLLLDNLDDVKERAAKKFPGVKLSTINPIGKLGDNVALAHYGINLGDKQPIGETYGREAHFEPELATPGTKDAWNKMLQNGIKTREGEIK